MLGSAAGRSGIPIKRPQHRRQGSVMQERHRHQTLVDDCGRSRLALHGLPVAPVSPEEAYPAGGAGSGLPPVASVMTLIIHSDVLATSMGPLMDASTSRS